MKSSSSNAATAQTIPSDVQEFSLKLTQISSDNYTPSLINELLKHSIPSDAKLIPTSSYLHLKDLKDLKRSLRDFDNGDATHAVIPMLIDADSRYAAIHLTKDGYSFSASFIDPRGGEEKTFTTQVSEYIFGKGADSGISPIPPHVLKALKSELNIDREDIALTTNKLQYSKMNGYGIRESDNNSGPMIVDALTSLARGDITVSGTRLVSKDGDNSLLKDRSVDSSKVAGEILRNYQASILVDVYKDQASALEKMNLEEGKVSSQKQGKIRGSDQQDNYRANSEVQNQVGVGLNPARTLGLIAKAVAFSAVLSATNGNNQQSETGVGSSLVTGGNHNSLRVGSGNLNIENPNRILTVRPPTRKPTSFPTGEPTSHPTAPTGQPSSSPSGQPSRQPTGQPSTQPTSQPSTPTGQPSRQPTGQPSRQPTAQPTAQPSGQPTGQPSSQPSQPSGQPSTEPTGQPSMQPSTNTSQPTGQPTSNVTDSTVSTSSHSSNERLIKEIPNEATYAGIGVLGVVAVAAVAVVAKSITETPSPSPTNAVERRKRRNIEINGSRR